MAAPAEAARNLETVAKELNEAERAYEATGYRDKMRDATAALDELHDARTRAQTAIAANYHLARHAVTSAAEYRYTLSVYDRCAEFGLDYKDVVTHAWHADHLKRLVAEHETNAAAAQKLVNDAIQVLGPLPASYAAANAAYDAVRKTMPDDVKAMFDKCESLREELETLRELQALKLARVS